MQRNVFDFDAFNPALRRTLRAALQRHNLPVDELDDADEEEPAQVRLAREQARKAQLAPTRALAGDVAGVRWRAGEWLRVETRCVALKPRGRWHPARDASAPPPVEPLRTAQFDERVWRWRPRERDGCGALVAAAFGPRGQLHVLSARPLRLYSVPRSDEAGGGGRTLALQQHLPWHTGSGGGSSADGANSFALLALADGRVVIAVGWFGLLLVVEADSSVTVFDAPPRVPSGAPALSVMGTMSFISRANSQQFANVQDAAFAAAKSPLRLAVRPASQEAAFLANGVAALAWRVGEPHTSVALLAFGASKTLDALEADVGKPVRTAHWLVTPGASADFDAVLLVHVDESLSVLRVPRSIDVSASTGAPQILICDVSVPRNTRVRSAMRSKVDGSVLVAVDEPANLFLRLPSWWPEANQSVSIEKYMVILLCLDLLFLFIHFIHLFVFFICLFIYFILFIYLLI